MFCLLNILIADFFPFFEAFRIVFFFCVQVLWCLPVMFVGFWSLVVCPPQTYQWIVSVGPCVRASVRHSGHLAFLRPSQDAGPGNHTSFAQENSCDMFITCSNMVMLQLLSDQWCVYFMPSRNRVCNVLCYFLANCRSCESYLLQVLHIYPRPGVDGDGRNGWWQVEFLSLFGCWKHKGQWWSNQQFHGEWNGKRWKITGKKYVILD